MVDKKTLAHRLQATLLEFYSWLVANTGLNLGSMTPESTLLTIILCSFLMRFTVNGGLIIR